MQTLEELGRELERGGRAEELRKLAASDEGKRLGAMLDRQAAERALKSGDAAALRRMLGELLATEEGRRLAEKLRRLS